MLGIDRLSVLTELHWAPHLFTYPRPCKVEPKRCTQLFAAPGQLCRAITALVVAYPVAIDMEGDVVIVRKACPKCEC